MTLWLFALAFAEPLTYREALEAASSANPSLRRAELSQVSAAGDLRSAQGTFDPMYRVEAQWRQSQSQGFFQGFPFTSKSTNWFVNQGLSGSTGTGTSYGVNLNLDRNYSEFITDFGLGAGQAQIQDTYTANINGSVTQQLLRGLRTKYNMENITLARQQATVADLELERTRQDTLFQAAQAYWTWAYQVELHNIAKEAVAVSSEALRVGRLQVESGQLAPVEGTRLEAAMVQAEQSELDARNTSEQAANTLLLLLARSPNDAIEPASKPGDVRAVELDVDRAIEVAQEQNLELALARQNLDISRIQASNAKHGRLPGLAATLAGGVAAQDTTLGNAIGGIAADDNQPFVAIGGQFDVPLGNRAARGNVDSKAATQLSRQVDLEEAERRVAAAVENQVRTLASAKRKTELADVNLRLAQETLAAEEALAEVGRSIQKNVLEARNAVQRSQADSAKARTDYRLAEAQLLQLQGQLTPTD